MKISIKFKLPLVIIVGFLIYMAAVLVFFKYYALKEIRVNLEAFRLELDSVAEETSAEIGKRYPDIESIDKYIHDFAIKKNVEIKVFNTNEDILLQVTANNNGGMSFSTQKFVKINDKIVYLVGVESPYMLKKIISMLPENKLLNFILISLSFAMILLIIYLHHYIVEPLTKLQKGLENVNYRSNTSTEALKRNDEIGDLYKKFHIMLKKLEASYQQQVEMISSISHDLKTPLTSIIGYVERLSNANIKTEEKKQEYYEIIYKKSKDIETLIEEFSDYTKNEYSLTKMMIEPVNIKSFFQSICEEYSEELASFNAEFVYRCEVNNNSIIHIDIIKMRRVFANLISNAIKYADSLIKINMRCEVIDNFVWFSVEDNGNGVPEDELNRIFSNFYRVDKSRSREKGGSGLGLAICKSIVEAHFGEIKAYNMKDKGFGVKFSIPM
ncbi:sensor protein kinase WalK [Clostridium homopropionicum DSM 5847]|uniref:histidine kinase n=1 Tax=Clostridium homopropionicum DSM 5847 TaxID=1121318 RepID=A0A0L6ZA05_9CLOT|nr:HAMP domain-containing sensor histidine kinase [Clostridium homopropionicum]KOA19806.1 sensor protein kinase WalK [Clostridium homopropionicum DSM 5847]SFF77065.1 Signal transduction histidine kinase [Clostridium homopropionicum]